ncbi:MAG: YqgE/AlgH family protein [Alphaproteobacteria bacterium]|nr:YqgE/AlgH family protein [Alphaproteobacteria bacterium]
MIINDGNYLTGKCLAAMPNMDDERFANSLIYICSHTKDGAMGFVVNKKIKEFSFADLANQLPISTLKPIEPIDLHQGGPLEKIRGFVLHSTDYIKSDTIVIDESIAVSSSIDIITDIAFGNGPRENLIALGYASWAPQQLEKEIINNSWLVTTPTPELVFRTKDEEKWQKAIDSLGFDINYLSSKAGRA